MECPHHKLRDDLPELTERIAKLPIDERGYPVPAFVQWFLHSDKIPACPSIPGVGTPDFRVIDPVHLKACVFGDICWVCGEKLGVHRAYVVGPMCTVNRNSAEPPSHVDCAEWSVKACPFLSKPQMKRREDEMTEKTKPAAGLMLTHNPGVTAIWQVSEKIKPWRDGKGGMLFDIGNPEKVTWWKEGRTATVDEVAEAINKGIERLLELCEDVDDRNEVARRRDALVATLKTAKGGSNAAS